MNATSASPVNFAPKHLSGIDVIDNAWGGLYRGGSYLVYGRAASGRGLLTLMFARTGAAFSEPTLFVSPDRQKDLMIQAASIGFNLREAHETGIVRLMRVPPLMNLQNMGDDGVSKALWDLVTLIRQHRPTRLIMNDFMPFVAFRSYDRFRNEFIQFLEQIDSLDTTTMLVMPEPANEQSARVIEFMASQMTGSIRIELGEDGPSTTKRRISLIPHIGHIKRQVVDYWDLEDLVETDVAPAMPSAPQNPIQDDSLIFTSTSAVEGGVHAAHTASQAPPTFEPTPPVAQSGPAEVQSGMSPSIPIPPVFQPQAPSPAPPQPAAPSSGLSPEPAQTAPQQQAPIPQPQAPSPAPPLPATPVPTAPVPQAPAPPVQVQAPVPQAPVSPSSPAERDYSDRESFRVRLESQFSNREVLHQPFLLLALRMDRSAEKSARPFDFDFLMDLVREELSGSDDMLAITDVERMVVFLGNSRAEEAQSFFARLKDRLRVESPSQADHLLHSVSAIVVPDGRPFQNATEFLTYALDEA